MKYRDIKREKRQPAKHERFSLDMNSRYVVYRHNNNIAHLPGGIAVVIQRMVNAEKSGVLFTTDPRGKRKKTMILESIYGLGEAIVSGLVTPDKFEIEKKRLIIIIINKTMR